MQGRDVRPWLTVAGLALGPTVANGFARFAYGLILPAMRDDLAWTYTQAGWINTANAIGYLIGAIVALALINRVGAARLFAAGMVLMTVALIGSGLTRDFWVLTGWRVLAGVAGAPVFIAAGSLAARLFKDNPRHSALAIALCLAGGGGLGMLLSGVVIPWLLHVHTASAWPQAWLALGTASALCVVPALRAVSAMPVVAVVLPASGNVMAMFGPAGLALLSYFLFGVGYIVYLTFLVAWMRDNGAGPLLIAICWSLLSIMVMVSPFVWQRALAAARAAGALAGACAMAGIAVLLPLVVPAATGMLASAALFGASFCIAPTAATTFSRRNFREHDWGSAMALFTTLFAMGQIVGPVAAGALADRAGGVSTGLAVAGLVLLASALAGVMQRPLRRL